MLPLQEPNFMQVAMLTDNSLVLSLTELKLIKEHISSTLRLIVGFLKNIS